MTTDEDKKLHEQLCAPFPPQDIEFRISQSGMGKNGPWAKVLAYVTNRAIQDRLDQVFGPLGWSNHFDQVNGGWLCTITIHTSHGDIHKQDGAQPTNFEPFKGGISDSMKRAGCHLGIGRLLYRLPEMWAEIVPADKARRRGAFYAHHKADPRRKGDQDFSFYWLPPDLPLWALPEGTTQEPRVTNTMPDQEEPTPNAGGEVEPTVYEAARRCITHPQVPDGMTKVQYYQAVQKRLEARRDDGGITAAEYETLMNDHYWPAVKEQCPEWYSTARQAEETFT